jgi:hypothetical protein
MTEASDRLNTALADCYTLSASSAAVAWPWYLARDFRHDRSVALKVLHPDHMKLLA